MQGDRRVVEGTEIAVVTLQRLDLDPDAIIRAARKIKAVAKVRGAETFWLDFGNGPESWGEEPLRRFLRFKAREERRRWR